MLGLGEGPPREAAARDREEPTPAAPSVSVENLRTLVEEMVELQKLRVFAIKGQQWCNRRTDSLIVGHLGYDPSAGDETLRKAMFVRAASLRKTIERTKEAPTGVGLDPFFYRAGYVDTVLASAKSRMTWDELREKNERALERAARELPVYDWAMSIRGFGERGLAIVVAEAAGFDEEPPGSGRLRRRLIGEYRTTAGLWKRMGLAVIDGQRQRKLRSTVEADKHRYKPERRAECWVLADSLLRAQLRSRLRATKDAILAHPDALKASQDRHINVRSATKVDTLLPIVNEFGLSAEPHPIGPYGEVYARRRIRTAPRIAETADLPDKIGDYANPLKWTPMRCHSDAARVMFKTLLRDLRREWRKVIPAVMAFAGCVADLT